MAKPIDTPTDFLIRACEDLDDVDMILIVRRHRNPDGLDAISYDINTHSGWDSYAMASAARTLALAHTIKSRLVEED